MSVLKLDLYTGSTKPRAWFNVALVADEPGGTAASAEIEARVGGEDVNELYDATTMLLLSPVSQYVLAARLRGHGIPFIAGDLRRGGYSNMGVREVKKIISQLKDALPDAVHQEGNENA